MTEGFPRGLPDGDPNKPTAAARWHSSDELTGLIEPWRPGLFLLGRDQHGRYFGHDDDRHVLTVAGSRAGKGVSLIVPNLLFWPGSVLAIDPKGELATLTASRRSAEGSEWSAPMDGEGEVYALDPFALVTGAAKNFAKAAFNPMAGLDPNTDAGADLAYQIADALIIQADGEGAFWTQSARSYLRAVIMWVAKNEEAASAHLLRVRELLMLSKDDRATLFAEMKACDIPIVARMGAAMEGRAYNEAGSILSACEAQTTFLEGEGMRRVLTGSSFRFEELKRKRVTIYLCLPATRLATHGRWLRLMVAMAFEAMERTGPKEEDKPAVLFCLDEFAALGRMESVEKAAGQIASFGVKLWPVVQDLTQLVRDYKEAWETFMGNAGCLTFWGNTDITTSEHVAKRLGELEVIRTVQNATETWARNEQGSVSDVAVSMLSGANAQPQQKGVTTGGNVSLSQSSQKTALMHGFEVVQAFARETGKLLVIIPGKPPIALFRCVHHGEADQALFGGLYDPVPGQKPPRINREARRARNA